MIRNLAAGLFEHGEIETTMPKAKAVQPFVERGMSLLFAAGSLHFFTTVEIAIALAFGASLGLIGSRAAVARYAEA